MKHPRFTAIFVAVSAASLLMASTAGFAAHHKVHHKVAKVEAEHHENFKGEANFKGEVPPPCPPVLMLGEGFYIGAGAGYDSYKFHHSGNGTITNGGGTVVDTFSSSSDLAATGWMGGLFVGYGRYFDWAYLGLEINGNDSSAKSRFNVANSAVGSVSVKTKARGSYGVGLLPGIKLNDSSLLYVRLAYLRANFKTSVEGTSVFTGMAFSDSDSEWRNGFQYGVGIETAVAENVSIRGEFDHTQFKSHSFSGSGVVNGFTVADSGSVKPTNNEFMLSLIYHFGDLV